MQSGSKCGEHPAPSLLAPWWEWACQECAPDAWHVFSENDARPEDGRPHTVQCPLCIQEVRYKDGRMRRHWEDSSVACRCSGLCEALAHQLLDALIAGRTAARFLQDRLTVHPRPAAVELDPNPPPLIEQLREARLTHQWTQDQVADMLHASRKTVAEWETAAARPLLDSAIRWAALFDLRLVLADGDYSAMNVDSASTASWWLAQRRGAESVNGLAFRIGVYPKRLARWESGNSSFQLADLQDWAKALDLTVELRGRS